MLNKLFFTFSLLLLGWFLNEKYTSLTLNPTQHPSIKPFFNTTTSTTKKVATPKEKELTDLSLKEKKIAPKTKPQQNFNFYDLLALYLDAPLNKAEKILTTIENFLETLAIDNPSEALAYLAILQEEAPQSNALNLLIKIHTQEKNFPKAIEYLKLKKEQYLSDEKNTQLITSINQLAKTYINTMQDKKIPTTQRIKFLEEMINFNENEALEEPFYSFILATLLYPTNKTVALELFDSLRDDENYAKKIRTYLHPNQQYAYAIKLTKYGVHYVANVYLDDVLCRLMLDTGASYILLDSQKGSFLPPIQNITLHTASNTINGLLAEANILRVGEVKLFNVKVTLAPFKREKIDGLLGMNFFEKFDFHIDQEKNILYLNQK